MLAFIFLGFLLVIGWDQSYKTRYENFQGIAPTPEPVPVAISTPVPAPGPARAPATPLRVGAAPIATPFMAATPSPAPPKDNSWMWKDTILNKPIKKGQNGQ